MSALKCIVPGCGATIREAATGLMELEKIRRHYLAAHLSRVTMREAMEIRAEMERRAEQAEKERKA